MSSISFQVLRFLSSVSTKRKGKKATGKNKKEKRGFS
jgi:hypothetical protein